MSRITLSAPLLCMWMCLSVSSFGQVGPHFGPTTFTGTTPNQIVEVNQMGTGAALVGSILASISQPSLTNLPPAALVGNATNASGSSVGVLGTSAGSFGFGLFGIASGTPGTQEEPTGVFGIATSTSGKTQGVHGEISSPDGIAVHAKSAGGRLFVGTSGPSGSETDKFSVDANGNVAAFGSLSLIGSPTPGDINAGNGTFTGNISSGGVGTFASVQTGNGNFNGNVRTNGSTSIGGPLIVLGNISAITSSASFANVTTGSLNAATGNFNSAVSMATVLTVGQSVTIGGDLHVAGAKSSVVEVSGGRTVALYAVESPENWFEDFGTAQMHDGTVRVSIEPLFAETVNSDLSYHVFLTPNGDCRGLYIAEKTATGFVVRELAGGKSNVAFDYRVVVRRKGYEKQRLAEVPGQQAAAPTLSSAGLPQFADRK